MRSCKRWVGVVVVLGTVLAAGCSGDDGPGAGGKKDAGTGAVSGTGGAGGTGPGGSGGAAGAAGAASGGAPTGGAGGAGGASGSDAGSDAPASGGAVGNPTLFTDSVLELDFAQGANGSLRANGGAWQPFGSWAKPGVNGSWSNTGVSIQTTNAIRTEIVTNAHGSGQVLRTWIEAGDQWKSSATYPRTELTSSYTANVAFKSEWRLEHTFYVTGDVANTGASIIGFQFHHNGNTGSPPFAFELADGALRFSIREAPSGTALKLPVFPLQADKPIQLVFEVKFGYVADGAYVRLWADGVKYVDVTDKNVGYPDLESTAGYWKLCSLYDWANAVKGSRSVYSGPVLKLLRRP